MDNSITSVVNDLLSYRQKIPTTLYNTKGCYCSSLFSFQMSCQPQRFQRTWSQDGYSENKNGTGYILTFIFMVLLEWVSTPPRNQNRVRMPSPFIKKYQG